MLAMFIEETPVHCWESSFKTAGFVSLQDCQLNSTVIAGSMVVLRCFSFSCGRCLHHLRRRHCLEALCRKYSSQYLAYHSFAGIHLKPPSRRSRYAGDFSKALIKIPSIAQGKVP